MNIKYNNMTIEQELIKRIKDLQEFCELNSFPLSEILEEELIYYKSELNLQDEYEV